MQTKQIIQQNLDKTGVFSYDLFREKRMEKIVSSPKYGLYMNKTFKVLSGIFISIMTLGLIVVLIGMFATGDYKELTRDEIISTTVALLICLFTDVVISIFYIRQCLFEKNLKLWRKDFVKIYVKVVADFDNDTIVGGTTALITAIKFTYEGQEHKIKFGAAYNMWAQNKAFKQIGNKIPIYYSPKYNQVVFIKEED